MEERPAFRQIDVRHIEQDGKDGVVLMDPLGIQSQQIFVPEGLLPIVGRFDGSRTIAEIENELSAESGEPLPEDFVAGLARQMDELLFLDSPQFRSALDGAVEEFNREKVRPSIHAGVSAGYPSDPEEAHTTLESIVRRPSTDLRPTPRGLVAPHIDLARGREGYSMAYSALAECEPADLYVVFGTGHQGPRSPITGLAMDWATPLGNVKTNREFVERVHGQLGPSDPVDLFLHRLEHSLEFQMLFLAHVLKGHEFEVAGFLTGHLPSSDAPIGEEPYVQQILETFRTQAEDQASKGRKVCFLAGADLAHIGPFFGDPDAVDQMRLDRLSGDELPRLQFLESNDPSGFHAAIEGTGNRDRVCGTTPMFLTAALADCPGRLLYYGQATAEDGSQTVSYCGMVFE